MENRRCALDGLKGLMRERGSSYRSVAAEVGIGFNTLSNKVNGKSDFTLTELCRIIAVLNMDETEIWRIFFAPVLQNETKTMQRATSFK